MYFESPARDDAKHEAGLEIDPLRCFEIFGGSNLTVASRFITAVHLIAECADRQQSTLLIGPPDNDAQKV
ncbi:hypothetical protein [Caballeronia glebae]|uniref:hypothetical protein n=1 Tax=Caballeronia glebae TaxID=1777143 RepID=UPI0038B8D5BC